MFKRRHCENLSSAERLTVTLRPSTQDTDDGLAAEHASTSLLRTEEASAGEETSGWSSGIDTTCVLSMSNAVAQHPSTVEVDSLAESRDWPWSDAAAEVPFLDKL
ncbi:hypothetical protein HPB50_029377 [Hyalomma asiaticum]|nr:hypothetical protein HPB50_029377 [Hyalomma asiaticum]